MKVDPKQKEHRKTKGRATPASLGGPGTSPETGYGEWFRIPFWYGKEPEGKEVSPTTNKK